MADEPVKPVEPQPAPQPDPVPPTTPENQIPQSRFNEVNEKRKEAVEKAEAVQKELDEIKLAQKTADEATLTEQEKFKELAEKREEENKLITGQLESLQAEAKTRWEGILKSIPEDKLEFFAVGESNEDVIANLAKHAEFVRAGVFGSESLSEVSNLGGHRTKSENNEFGGYESRREWADKDPKSYGEHRKKINSLDDSIGTHTVISKM